MNLNAILVGRMSAEIVAHLNEPSIGNQSSPSNATMMRQSNKSTLQNFFLPSSSSLSYQVASNAAAHLRPASQQVEAAATSIAVEADTLTTTGNLFHRLARSLADSSNLFASEEHQTATALTMAPDKQSMMQTDSQQQQQSIMQREQSFTEGWNEYWSRKPFPSGYTQSSIILLACFISTIIFLIVVGNLLVCIAIFTEKSLKPTQNWFIASLAVSDMLLGALVMPISLARELMGFWAFGPLWCDVHEAMDVLLSTASINTLCLISLDRYWSITQAVNYLKKRTPRRGALMIAFVWLFSAAVSLPPLFGWKKENVSIIVSVASDTANHTASGGKVSNKTRNSAGDSNVVNENDFAPTELPPPPPPDSRRRRRHKVANSDRLARRQLGHRSSSEQNDQANSLLDQEQEDFFATTLQPLLAASTNLLPSGSNLPSNNLNQPQIAAANQSPQTAEQTTEYPSCQLSDDVGYVLYSALGSFYIPCAVMVFTYIKIFLAARSRARRAISKSSRATGAQTGDRGKRAGRRGTPSNEAFRKLPAAATASPVGVNEIGTDGTTMISCGQMTRNAHNSANSESIPPARLDGQVDVPGAEGPMLKGGKLVIVERKKSLAAGASISPAPFHTPTADQSPKTPPVTTETVVDYVGPTGDHSVPISLSTSGAKLASQTNAFTSSNDSSMITVMNASMGELPVTRFSFQASSKDGTSAGDTSLCSDASDQDEKAAALLRSLHQVGGGSRPTAGDSGKILKKLFDSPEAAEKASGSPEAPDIVVDQGRKSGGQRLETDQECPGACSTNETCFMTIEEDSDMLDAQAGRTIMMVAGGNKKQQVAKGQQASNVITMMPSTTCNQQLVCNNVNCPQQHQRQQTRSASSYCGSSMTINDDDIDDCVDDELLTDDCNGFSVSCGLDQYCSGGALACPHCQELENEEVDDGEEEEGEGNNNKTLGAGKSSGAKFEHNEFSTTKASTHHQCPMVEPSNGAETQSLTGDDNLSLTDYRSNEDDSSSFMGHDVLDATDTHKKKYSTFASAGGQQKSSVSGAASDRKRSMIGFRLGRLGSSALLSNQSGGLLALATSTQQQCQKSQSQQPPARNLKALRQNFFFKLNQLTAKSAVKQETKRELGESQNSPSAPSSGTSYEPSVDNATTSNIHSTDYHHETVLDGQTKDLEQNSDIIQNNQRFQAAESTTNETTTGDSQHSYNDEANRKSQQEATDGKARPSKMNGGASTGESNSKALQLSKNSHNRDDVGALNRRRLGPSSGNALLLKDPNRQQENQLSGATQSADLTQGAAAIPTSAPSKAHNKLQRATIAVSGGQLNRSSTIMSSSVNTGSVANKAYLASDNERHKRKLAKARERRATLILGIIMTAFICSWLPFFTFYVLRAICISCREFIPPSIEAFIFWMGYCNSAINPIIYTIFNRDFRRAFRKIIFRC